MNPHPGQDMRQRLNDVSHPLGASHRGDAGNQNEMLDP